MMTDFKPITFERYADKTWICPKNYKFASGDSMVALGATEIPKIIMNMAIGFVPDNENFIPVAILGIKNGQNLMVEESGQWIEHYVPAAYRTYPFRLAQGEEDKYFLCINEESNLVVESGEGEPFYNSEGKWTENTKKIIEKLVAYERDLQLSGKICKALNYAGVIEPWPMKLESEDEIQEISGLFRISEEKLNSLDSEAFAELREGGSILLAYCQLLSIQHIQKLGRLAWSRKDGNPGPNPAAPSEFSFENESGTLSFENL